MEEVAYMLKTGRPFDLKLTALDFLMTFSCFSRMKMCVFVCAVLLWSVFLIMLRPEWSLVPDMVKAQNSRV